MTLWPVPCSLLDCSLLGENQTVMRALKQPYGKELRLLAHSQHPLAMHVREPPRQ